MFSLIQIKIGHRLINISFFFLFLTTITFSPFSIHAQTDYIVVEVKFSGNQTLSSRQLFEQITTYPTSTFKRILLRKKPYLFNEKIFQTDLQRLKKYYQSEGFLDIEIKHERQINDKKKSVRLSIFIIENKPMIVRQVNFELDTADEHQNFIYNILSRLKHTLQLQSNRRFHDKALIEDQTKISQIFSDEGFPYISVKYSLQIDQEKKTVDLVYHISSGPQCEFGEITITDNSKTPDAVIRKHLAFDTGDIFKQKLIAVSQLQLYQLGFFQSVMIKYLMDDDQDHKIPVQITVKESARLLTKVGFGLGKEDEFRVFTDILRLGFLGGDRRLSLFLKHSGLEPYHANLKFTQPAFLHPKTNFHLNAFIKREDEPGYNVKRIGTNPILQHQITAHTNVHFGYNLEQVYQKISEVTKKEALNNRDLSLYNKSSITLGLVKDNATPKFSPTQGMFNAFTYTLSGLGFNSKYYFTKSIIEIRRYQQSIANMILAFKVKIGMMTTWKNTIVTPIEERFFAGGSMSVRGWARSQLSPKNSVGIPIGGNSHLEASFECRIPIWNIFSFVTFLDLGNVWEQSLTYQLSELRYAFGGGLRIKTPIGPIRIDIARPIFDTEKNVQFHISVGQAF